MNSSSSPSPKSAVRRLIFHLHLYAGLITGLLLSLTGLTGSALVFRHELDSLLSPHLHHVAPGPTRASLQQILDAVQHARPDDSIRHLSLAQTPEASHELRMASGMLGYVDPYRGQVLGFVEPEQTVTGFLFALHTKLLNGDQGKTVVGIGGIVLMILGLTGVYLWWPGKKGLRSGFTVQWRASWKRINYDFHRVFGIVSLAVLMLVTLTGVALVFGVFFTNTVHRLTRTPPSLPLPKVEVPANAAPLPIDLLLAKADAALPGAAITRVSFPAKPGAPLAIRKRFPQELHTVGRSSVTLNPYTGEVFRVENALTVGIGPRLLNLRFPLHIGSYGGLLVRVLYLIVGLTPATLFGSGCVMWWNRTRAWRRKRVTKAVAVTAR